MRAKLITANWKMNGSFVLIDRMFEGLSPLLGETSCDIVICPPDVLLFSMRVAFEKTRVIVGAQNVHSKTSGSYTGEISAPMLQECGVGWCIVGHSERRQQFNETDEFIRGKIETLLKYDIRPILCVGESLEHRESGKHEEIVVSQLRRGIAGLSIDEQLSCVLAYEPIWAIGTGETATPEQASSMHKIIRNELELLSSSEVADKVRILYGGSVNEKNAGVLLSQKDIDGVLVGSASLKKESFQKIILAAS